MQRTYPLVKHRVDNCVGVQSPAKNKSTIGQGYSLPPGLGLVDVLPSFNPHERLFALLNY